MTEVIYRYEGSLLWPAVASPAETSAAQRWFSVGRTEVRRESSTKAGVITE
jgi:hypothetical protein